ncbi:unnamed protein product [Lathyrus oleraceus]
MRHHHQQIIAFKQLRPCDNESRNQKTKLKPRRQVKLDSKQLTNQCNAAANISDISPHLCFTCLLHSANQNGLRLQGFPNLDNLSIFLPHDAEPELLSGTV